MFIAHAPAGYLLTKWMQSTFNIKRFLWIGLLASVLPDFDLLYFYSFDHQQTLHHHYWTHLPIFWIIVTISTIITFHTLKHKDLLIISAIFFANIFLHLLHDTYVGGINWLYPLFDHDFFMITVPTTQSVWIQNFIFHWSFLLELIICIFALIKLTQDLRKTDPAK